jgi:Tfp pilus assembly protein FimT
MEIMIMVVIMIILAAIAIPRVSPVVMRFRLQGGAWQLAGDLRLARQRAVTLQKRFRICIRRCAISVPAGTYSLERDDGTVASPRWVSETGATIKLPQDVTVAGATTTFSTTGQASGSTFTLTNPLGTYQVVVGATGRVQVCEGSC